MSAHGVLSIDLCKDIVPQQIVDALHDYASTDKNKTEEDDGEIDFFWRIRLWVKR